MILVFEMTWTGAVHAPGNSATIQILARAWPGQKMRVHADPTHLAELSRDPAFAAFGNVETVPIEVSPHFTGRTQIVSWRRMAQEWRTVRAALARLPAAEPVLIFLISTTATGTFAAAWAARLAGRQAAVQVCFHGNLNDALGWRPRNPIVRAFDTRAAIERRHPVPVRFMVLEQAILDRLAAVLPGALGRTDVLPLPINTGEIPTGPSPGLTRPVRFGFVGLGTEAKGIDLFLSVARRARARWGDAVEFIHVGRMPDGADYPGMEALAISASSAPLPRAEFTRRLASLHYVFLPFREEGYYQLSASGALLDALTWLKPIVATRVPLTQQYFSEYGDIGALCDDDAAMEQSIERILATMDADRYADQVGALRRARESREVGVLAHRYHAMVSRGFPGLLPDDDGIPADLSGMAAR